ncbi:MAG: MoxR family ATPase [Lachnospiraceae bacterium]|nr:MoxR family ATPase [bacterium]MDY5518600.1 MoxR family ATPase [Lachnospiraceae bacterium]
MVSYEIVEQILSEVRKVISGKDACIEKAFAAMLAGGHILIEDVPGVGKTTLALAFSAAMSLNNHRMQFTPDVLPADILGFTMYDRDQGTFFYREGAIMCNLFLADEINRTSPKTQSALLEVMEEQRVTVDGIGHELPEPFLVIATENPKGSAGTQLLPESQLDRFMICMSMGYPDFDSEVRIAQGKSSRDGVEQIQPVIDAQGLVELQHQADRVYVHESIYEYITRLVAATRDNGYIDLGVSPRGTIACVRMVKAWAYVHDRDYVLPEDVTDIFLDVTAHRIVLNTKARVAKLTSAQVLGELMEKTAKPASFIPSDAHRRKRS